MAQDGRALNNNYENYNGKMSSTSKNIRTCTNENEKIILYRKSY